MERKHTIPIGRRKSQAVFWAFCAVVLFVVVLIVFIRRANDKIYTIREERVMTTVQPVMEQIVSETTEPTPEETEEPFVKYPVPLDDDLQKYIIETATEHGIDPSIVFSVINTETCGTFNANSVGDNGESYGLMQVYQSEHTKRMERLCVWNLFDPYQNVAVGIDVLAELIDYYDGDVERALSFYHGNGGELPDAYASIVRQNAEILKEGAVISDGKN